MPGQIETLHVLFEELSIEAYKKKILQERYLAVLSEFKTRAMRLSISFYGMRTVITVGSILVPAFLSIQGTNVQPQLYWVTWMISILVTICNGIMTLFKLDKKYFFINTTLELLHSEGWQYLGLSGRYTNSGANESPTHDNQFLIFFHMAEKIKMRQVEEEYWKFTDTSGIGNATTQRLISPNPTPDVPQLPISSMAPDQTRVINTWIGEMKGLEPRDPPVNSMVVVDGEGKSP
jgi:hypothetical protein